MSDLTGEQSFRFISEILHTIASTNRHEEILHRVVDRTVRLTHCQTCAVVLVDPKTEFLRIDNYHGLSHTFCNAFRRQIATAAVGELLWTGIPIVLTGEETDRRLADAIMLEHPFASCACVQIAVDQRTLGYLHVDSRQENAFTEADIRVLKTLADIAGVGIVKSRMFEENLRLERVDRETGLDKYAPLLEKFDAALARAEELGETFAVLLLDVDNFKDIVNTFGYDASRQILLKLGDLVKGMLRPIDSAGRFGFDEIIVVIGNTGLEAALNLATTLRQTIDREPFTPMHIRSTVSIGVASYPENGITREELILTAKQALFEAQRSGRNSVIAVRHDLYVKEEKTVPAV